MLLISHSPSRDYWANRFLVGTTGPTVERGQQETEVEGLLDGEPQSPMQRDQEQQSSTLGVTGVAETSVTGTTSVRNQNSQNNNVTSSSTIGGLSSTIRTDGLVDTNMEGLANSTNNRANTFSIGSLRTAPTLSTATTRTNSIISDSSTTVGVSVDGGAGGGKGLSSGAIGETMGRHSWNSATTQNNCQIEDYYNCSISFGGLAWRTLEATRCELTPEALLINLLRSKLPPGCPVKAAMKNPIVVGLVGKQFKKEMVQRHLRQKMIEFQYVKKKRFFFSLEGSFLSQPSPISSLDVSPVNKSISNNVNNTTPKHNNQDSVAAIKLSDDNNSCKLLNEEQAVLAKGPSSTSPGNRGKKEEEQVVAVGKGNLLKSQPASAATTTNQQQNDDDEDDESLTAKAEKKRRNQVWLYMMEKQMYPHK